MALDEAQQIGGGDRLHDDVVEGDDRRRPGRPDAGEGVELADELARTTHGDDDLAAVSGRAHDLEPARADEERVIAAVALEDQVRAAAVAPDRAERVELRLRARAPAPRTGRRARAHGSRPSLRFAVR